MFPVGGGKAARPGPTWRQFARAEDGPATGPAANSRLPPAGRWLCQLAAGAAGPPPRPSAADAVAAEAVSAHKLSTTLREQLLGSRRHPGHSPPGVGSHERGRREPPRGMAAARLIAAAASDESGCWGYLGCAAPALAARAGEKCPTGSGLRRVASLSSARKTSSTRGASCCVFESLRQSRLTVG